MKINSSAATTKIKVWSKSKAVSMKAGEYLLILPDRDRSEALFLEYFLSVSKDDRITKFSAIPGKYSLSIPEGSEQSESSSGAGCIYTVDIADLVFTRKGETLDERAFGGQAQQQQPLTPEQMAEMLKKLAVAPV